MNNSNMDALIKVVSGKLGVPAEQLKKELSEGKFDNAMKNMSPADAMKFNMALKNPQMVQQMMSTPEAKSLYNKLTGKG